MNILILDPHPQHKEESEAVGLVRDPGAVRHHGISNPVIMLSTPSPVRTLTMIGLEIGTNQELEVRLSYRKQAAYLYRFQEKYQKNRNRPKVQVNRVANLVNWRLGKQLDHYPKHPSGLINLNLHVEHSGDPTRITDRFLKTSHFQTVYRIIYLVL